MDRIMTKLTIWGGAGEHGRSAYLLSGDGYRLLLDCGVKKAEPDNILSSNSGRRPC
ncbi:hypothetical protein ACFTAO_26280 [Paenibacillus rhizoplanae]